MKKILLTALILLLSLPELSAQDSSRIYSSYLDSLTVFDLELDSVVFVAGKRSTKRLSRKDKKSIVERFKKQLREDFPKDIKEYNVSSSYVVRQEREVMTSGRIRGIFVESPFGSSKKKDTVLLKNAVYDEYINEELKSNLKNVIWEDSTILDRAKMHDPSQMKDRAKQIHALLWGVNPSSMLDILEQMDGKWDFINNDDGTSYVVFRGKKGFMGFFRIEWKVNFLVETRTLSVRDFTQEVKGKVSIPFGYKLDEEQLDMLNAANIAYSPFEKFRVRKANAVVKRYLDFRMDDRGVIQPVSKVVDMQTSVTGRKKAVINISARAEAVVQ